MTSLNTLTERTSNDESNIALMKRLLASGMSENTIVARFCRRYRARYASATRAWVNGRVQIYARIAWKDATVRAAREAHGLGLCCVID